MEKITATVGQVPEKFSQKRRVPRLPLIIAAILFGLIGGYVLVRSFAATPPVPGSKIYGVDNAGGWGQASQAAQQLGTNGERACQDDFDLNNGALLTMAAAGVRATECINSYDAMTSLAQHTQDYANLVADQARTYGPGGTYWTSHSQYAAYAIQSFELMNEPYGWWYRNGDNDPAAYAHIVAAAIRAGHAANPQAKFYIPLAPGDVKLANGSWVDWNQAMLQAEPSLFSLADGFSIHIYDTPTNFASILDQRKNWAWSQTGGNGKPFIITEANLTDQQASPETDYVAAMPQFVQIAQNRSWVKELFIFCWHGFSGRDYLGFLATDGTPRTARINAYRTAVQQALGNQPSADTTTPSVSLTSPTAGSSVSGQVSLAANASDDVGVSKVEFYVDNSLVATDTSAPYTATWNAANASAGSHTITVKAYDAAGNVGSDSKAVTVQSAGSGNVSSSSASSLSANGNTPFVSTSFWNAPLPASTPVDTNTANYVNWIKQDLTAYSGYGDINTDSYTPPMYTVPAGTATTNFKFNDCQNKGYTPTDMLSQLTNVPVPSYAQPSAGGDQEMVIYQPSTDTEWEMWGTQHKSDGWYACWGGRISNVSQSNGIFPAPYGVTASGLPFLGGVIRASELQSGTINHAVGFSIIRPGTRNTGSPNNDTSFTNSYVWPADRTDGSNNNASAPVEGTRFRLDPSVNVDSLSLTPTAKAIAKAAQKYGMVLWDTSGVVGFRAENAVGFTSQGQANPYPAIFGSTPSYNQLKGFPWDKLQALPAGYGKPGTSSSPSQPATDTTTPTVSFTAPANNATVSGIVTATVDASDNVGVEKVEISLDGSLKMTDTTAPYNYSFDSKTLSNGNHTLRAKAYDAAGNSSTATITINVQNADTTPPSTPTNIQASAVSATQVNLTWSASTDSGINATGIKNYNVLRNGTVIAQPTTASFTDTTAVANTQYSYVIQAVDNAGNVSANSAVATVTTPGGSSFIFEDNFESGNFNKWYVQALPNRVTNLSGGAAEGSHYAHFTVSPGDVEPDTGSSRAELSGPTFNEGQDLYIRDSIRVPSNSTFSGPWELIHQLHETNWSGSPGIAVFLNPGPKFDLRNGKGAPNFWESANLQTGKWYDLVYHVKLSQDPSVGYVQVWLDGVPQTLMNGQTTMYGKTIQTNQTYLKVGIYRDSTSSGTSLIDHDNIIVGTSYDAVAGSSPTPPPDTTPPSTPSGATVSAVSWNQVNLKWSASTDAGSGIAGYNVYRNGTKLNSALVTSTSYGDTSVNATTSYSYQVEAVDGAGNKSSKSTAVSATTPQAPDTTPPTVPGELKVSAAGPSQVKLTWGASTDGGGSGIAGYNVYRNGTKLNQAPLTATSYADANVEGGKTYLYQVAAVDKEGNVSNKTGSVSVTTPTVSNSSGGQTGSDNGPHDAGNSGQSGSSGSGAGKPSERTTSVVLTVYNQQRQPAVGAMVTIYGQTAKTNRQGSAYFTNIPVGKQDVSVRYADETVSHNVQVKASQKHSKRPQTIKFSLANTTLNPLLLLAPVIVLVGSGLVILRPWHGRFAGAGSSEATPQIVSSNDDTRPQAVPSGRKLETPGTVYSPEDKKDTK